MNAICLSQGTINGVLFIIGFVVGTLIIANDYKSLLIVEWWVGLLKRVCNLIVPLFYYSPSSY